MSLLYADESKTGSLYPSHQIPLLLQERQIEIAQQQAWEGIEAGWRAREAARAADRASKVLSAISLTYLRSSPKAAPADVQLDHGTQPAVPAKASGGQGLWIRIAVALCRIVCAALSLLMGNKTATDRFPRATSSLENVLRRDDATRLKHQQAVASTTSGRTPILLGAVSNTTPRCHVIGFLDLPAEIRNQIYAISIAELPKTVKLDWKEPIVPKIAQTCRQIRHEYLSIYFYNKIIIANMIDRVKLSHVQRWLGTVKYAPGAKKSFESFRLQYSQSPVEDFFDTDPRSRGPQHLELAMMVQSMAELGLSRDKVEFSIDRMAYVSPQERLTFLSRSELALDRAYRIVNR
ncbi:hypothetical protein CKM354_000732800 [Cercospora kikuchii]|uniref:Uncharacterized protein n=1 Tax=Cercospora kikuchii TaxID=84275 RepID=A0A9P3CJR7_9PEZI|nr:uncharacterized protein CKM354_000732800 [Cercospora kikuchii]GIZ44119.1 hypothetical protein CKM354_000732800 [Cercospora kikuchii]